MNINFTMGVFACALWLTAVAQAAQPTAPIVLSADAPDAHVVVKGDTLWDISRKYRVPLKKMLEINQIGPEQRLKVGSCLKVPAEENKKA